MRDSSQLPMRGCAADEDGQFHLPLARSSQGRVFSVELNLSCNRAPPRRVLKCSSAAERLSTRSSESIDCFEQQSARICGNDCSQWRSEKVDTLQYITKSQIPICYHRENFLAQKSPQQLRLRFSLDFLPQRLPRISGKMNNGDCIGAFCIHSSSSGRENSFRKKSQPDRL